MHVFPEKAACLSATLKVKEQHFTDRIKATDLGLPPAIQSAMAFDRRIDGTGACGSRRRPDVFIDLLTHSLVLENDEEQHVGYSCENKRIMELFQDAGGRPLVVLRFNPDSYTRADGSAVKSYFKYHKLSGVPPVNKAEFDRRMAVFLVAAGLASGAPDKEVTIEQFFYDDCEF